MKTEVKVNFKVKSRYCITAHVVVSLRTDTTYRHVSAEFEQSGAQDSRSEEAEEYEPAHNLVPDFFRFCNTKSRV